MEKKNRVKLLCCYQESGHSSLSIITSKDFDEIAESGNWRAMASVASSSSFSTRLLLHSHTPLVCRRRCRPNFLRMVTRSCLDDSSALLRAAQHTVLTMNSWIPFSAIFKICLLYCTCLIVINIWFFMPI